MVGGYVRDALRGILSKDRDFVVSGDVNSFVREIRDILGGTIVRFRKSDMVRLALEGSLTFDFSSPIGTAEEDLSKRDFTINAIAWSPESGVIDRYDGIEDLEKRRIRMISMTNLISDPLRLLRAYRFAAELGGSIEKRTRDAIKALHNRIEGVSPERITLELFHLLNSKSSFRYLRQALRDGVLASILSISDGVLESNIIAISVLERRTLELLPAEVKVMLDTVFSQNLSYKGLLCLELLLHGGAPNAGKVRMSSSVVKRVQGNYRRLANIRRSRAGSQGRLFDTFVELRGAALDVLIIAGRLDLLGEYRRFTNIMKSGTLGSRDIMKIMDVKPGPSVGKALLALRRAKFLGMVRSRAEAVDFISKRSTAAATEWSRDRSQAGG